MNKKAFRFLLPAVAIGVLGGYLWHSATRDEEVGKSTTANAPTRSASREDAAQRIRVTDDEVARYRDELAASPGPGNAISDAEIRKLLEDRKRALLEMSGLEELPEDSPFPLIPSMENPADRISPADIDRMLEPKMDIVPESEEEGEE